MKENNSHESFILRYIYLSLFETLSVCYILVPAEAVNKRGTQIQGGELRNLYYTPKYIFSRPSRWMVTTNLK